MKKGLIVFLVIIGFLIAYYHFMLPQSFIMQIEGDFSSSGASRNIGGTYVVRDNILVEGQATYTGGREEIRTEECIYTNRSWINKETNEACAITFVTLPATTQEIKWQIVTKELKRNNPDCTHDEICYSIGK